MGLIKPLATRCPNSDHQLSHHEPYASPEESPDMSLKGVSKTLTRAPQTFKQRFNIGETTKDAVYIDAERRFEELEMETKKLHAESRKYFEAINGT